MFRYAVFALLFLAALGWAAPFTVTPDTEIVIQFDAATKTGADWAKYAKLPAHVQGPEAMILRTTAFLREGIQRMTGNELPVASKNDLAKGIVLTTLVGAPAAVRNDPNIQWSLKDRGGDSYNANEAFYLRSEPERVLVVANTPDGLATAVVELLLSVEYEVLGMGPNWIYVPDYHHKPLVFDLRRNGRPGYYLRSLWATSGQSYGVGTLTKVADPADEPVGASYQRWLLGTRMSGRSMPGFPGHAMQGYHKAVAEKMLETNTTDGFLVPKCSIGADADRPAASEENKGQLWLNTERGEKGALQAYMSDGKTWTLQNLNSFHANLDMTVPLVREVVLAAMKERTEKSFADNPDDVAVFGFDPEDGGGYAVFDKLAKDPNWYPEYRRAIGDPLGKPYVLHGYNGLNQPKESWDPSTPCDTVFGFADWLLREYDRWIDTLPAEGRVTATGKAKKDLVRCSGYSYNYHDVPPSFNPDPRIRVMIASYPKHRGRGKWEKFRTQLDMAKAFQVMLPREPSGDYRIISLSYYHDFGIQTIPARWSASPAALAANYGDTWRAGVKAMSIETDFNFGKFGLAYYLITQTLWNPELTPQQLDAIRDRWLQKAYGGAWREMKAYYDFMLSDNFTVNGPNAWAKAVRLIDDAQKKLDGAKEPDAQRRLDDLKQYWYYYYLLDSGQTAPPSPALREYVWKGQMSYMVAMHMVTKRHFEGNYNATQIAGPEWNAGPAHYTHEETQAWWAKLLAHWPYTPVALFSDAALANGKPAKSVDLDDLVRVQEFAGGPAEQPFAINSFDVASVLVATRAAKQGEPIGFKMLWPFNPPGGEAYIQRKVYYGVDVYNPATRAWDALVDKTMIFQTSDEATNSAGKPVQYLQVSMPAPKAGLYRFDIGRGGRLANIAGLGYDLATGKNEHAAGFTFFDIHASLTQSPVFFYIPKGTKRLDFEVADTYKGKTLVLYSSLPGAGMKESRKIDCGKMGTYTVDLQPGEDGTVAMIRANGLGFPYFYSIPGSTWAKSPAALMIPRAIAEADGLTIE